MTVARAFVRFAMPVTIVLTIAAVVLFEVYEYAESPANQLFGKTLVSGPRNQRVVALTFDDGPNPPYTSKILDVLRRQRVHATFFVVGRAVQAYPAVVRQEARDGDAIGNHTWSHEHLTLDDPASIADSLLRTDRAIYAATGRHTKIMRPPFGARDWMVLDQVRKLGYTPVMWSDPLAKDWEYPPASTIAARVLRYVGDGSIVDLHDGNRGIVCGSVHVSAHVCDRSADVQATQMIVESLKRQGYRFVTIPELLRMQPAPLTHTNARADE